MQANEATLIVTKLMTRTEAILEIIQNKEGLEEATEAALAMKECIERLRDEVLCENSQNPR